MTCNFCGGSAHPATGCQYSENCISCWRCTKDFWRWVKGWTGVTKKFNGTKLSFYGAVETSQKLLARNHGGPWTFPFLTSVQPLANKIPRNFSQLKF